MCYNKNRTEGITISDFDKVNYWLELVDYDLKTAKVMLSSISKNILDDMAKLFKLRRNISIDIEPILLIDEKDSSWFLDNILSYGEVVYAR